MDMLTAIHIAATPTPIPAAAPLDKVPPDDDDDDDDELGVAVSVVIPVPLFVNEVAIAVPSRSSGRQIICIMGAFSENAVTVVVEAVPLSTVGTTCSLVIACDTTSHVPAAKDPVGTTRVQVWKMVVAPLPVAESDLSHVLQSNPWGQQPTAVSDPVMANWKLNSRVLPAVAEQRVTYPAGQERPGEYTPQPWRGCVGVGALVVRGGQHEVSSASPEKSALFEQLCANQPLVAPLGNIPTVHAAGWVKTVVRGPRFIRDGVAVVMIEKVFCALIGDGNRDYQGLRARFL